MKAFVRRVQENKHPVGEAVLCSTSAGRSMGEPERGEGMRIYEYPGWSRTPYRCGWLVSIFSVPCSSGSWNADDEVALAPGTPQPID